MDDLMPDINGSRARSGPGEPDLFSAPAAEAAKEEAIDRVEEAAPDDWLDTAAEAIRARVDQGATFTTDDLWRELPKPPEPRAMGAAIRAAVREGLIRKTGRYLPSERAICHGRPIPEWRPVPGGA